MSAAAIVPVLRLALRPLLTKVGQALLKDPVVKGFLSRKLRGLGLKKIVSGGSSQAGDSDIATKLMRATQHAVGGRG